MKIETVCSYEMLVYNHKTAGHKQPRRPQPKFLPHRKPCSAEFCTNVHLTSAMNTHCLLLCCYIQAHTKGISALVMLSEGTLLSGGEKDRKIIAWDTLQNYKKITETKVGKFIRRY
jgi:hypothetical protein